MLAAWLLWSAADGVVALLAAALWSGVVLEPTGWLYDGAALEVAAFVVVEVEDVALVCWFCDCADCISVPELAWLPAAWLLPICDGATPAAADEDWSVVVEAGLVLVFAGVWLETGGVAWPAADCCVSILLELLTGALLLLEFAVFEVELADC